MIRGKIIPNARLLTDDDYRRLSSAGIRRVSAADGCARLALEVGCDERTMRNARDRRSSLSGASLFNMLAKDPSALDELLAHFGYRAAPIDAATADDAGLNADVAHLNAVVAEAMRDGRIDHIENARVLDAARPVVQTLTGRIASAGRAA
ncbi:hypothetical protein [Sandarakinorhabdus sp. DWP1-3-1]|uniref:hypothetical protein n=1 Tax=Sandarakinorhabdus sp. DWP1-3-1 TaxID=2804627 RepID=UPI003CFA9EB7